MTIVAVNLRSIEASKDENVKGDVEINNNVTPLNVREQDMPGIGQNGIAIEFQYISKYTCATKTLGEIKIKGEVYYIGEDCKEIVKKWKKDKEIPEDQYLVIINTIFRRCAIKALQLAEDIQLPPPIGLPFAKKPEKRNN